MDEYILSLCRLLPLKKQKTETPAMAVDHHHFNKLMLLFLKNITCIFMSLCLVCSFFNIHINPAAAELQTFQHPQVIKGRGGGSGVVYSGGGGGGSIISFLVIGDWGRRGTYNQSELAVQMGIIGEKLDIDFIISTGDNFYDSGLTDENDPAFEDSFTNIYTAPSLQKQWYTVLGNHDYRGNALAQLSPILAQKDSRWVCLKSFIVNVAAEADIAEFFFIDTTPFQDKYFTYPGDQVYDWRGVHPRKNYISKLLKDLDLALRESTSKWKIVVGHHPIKSSGYHGNTKELVTQLLPILQANNVDFYINGHDHCLEHISCPDSPLQYFTSGGGSKAWRGEMSWWNPVETKFYYDGQGFMSMQITQNQVYVVFYDVFGKAIHEWTTSKLLYNAI